MSKLIKASKRSRPTTGRHIEICARSKTYQGSSQFVRCLPMSSLDSGRHRRIVIDCNFSHSIQTNYIPRDRVQYSDSQIVYPEFRIQQPHPRSNSRTQYPDFSHTSMRCGGGRVQAASARAVSLPPSLHPSIHLSLFQKSFLRSPDANI